MTTKKVIRMNKLIRKKIQLIKQAQNQVLLNWLEIHVHKKRQKKIDKRLKGDNVIKILG